MPRESFVARDTLKLESSRFRCTHSNEVCYAGSLERLPVNLLIGVVALNISRASSIRESSNSSYISACRLKFYSYFCAESYSAYRFCLSIDISFYGLSSQAESAS